MADEGAEWRIVSPGIEQGFKTAGGAVEIVDGADL
jgi:hypothetical protein